MISPSQSKRTLALYPQRRGLAYVLLDRDRTLLTFGRRWISADRPGRTLKAMDQLVTMLTPASIVLECSETAGNRRRDVNQRLLERMNKRIDPTRHLRVTIRTEQIQHAFRGRDIDNKDDRAQLIAQLYPILQRRLPPRREVWMAESESMGVFDAMSLALAHLGVPEEPVPDRLSAHPRL